MAKSISPAIACHMKRKAAQINRERDAKRPHLLCRAEMDVADLSERDGWRRSQFPDGSACVWHFHSPPTPPHKMHVVKPPVQPDSGGFEIKFASAACEEWTTICRSKTLQRAKRYIRDMTYWILGPGNYVWGVSDCKGSAVWIEHGSGYELEKHHASFKEAQ